MVPTNKIELLPLIKKLFYKEKIYKIKEILLGGQKAQIYMNDLITQAEESMEDVD